MSAIAFLAHILPQEGLRCAFLIVNGRPANYFFTSTAELASFIQQHDDAGHTVYHACGTFNRKARRALYAMLRSLFMDIDCGPDAVIKGKGYATIDDAIRAVADFCGRLGLPLPLFVCSGYGLHVYWIFDTALSREQWQPYANGLKAAAGRLGLCNDPARTADAASILRTPGTHNRKHQQPVAVRAGPDAGPFPLSTFEVLLHGSETASAHAPALLGRDLSHLARAKPSVSSISIPDLGPSAPRCCDIIADKCAQIRLFRETGSAISEAHWKAACGVTAFADDGQEKTHEWSKKDPRYNPAETQKKIEERLKNQTGASLCSQFWSLPEAHHCNGCPFKGTIKSPIGLGSRRDAGAASLTSPSLSQAPQSISPPEELKLPALPPPFDWHGQTIETKLGAGPQAKPFIVSEFPVWLHGVSKKEVSGTSCLILKHYFPHDGLGMTTVEHSAFFGPAGMKTLHDAGIGIHGEQITFFKDLISKQRAIYKRDLPDMTTYTQQGFKPEGFLLGDKLYTLNGVQRVSIDEKLRTRATFLGPGCGNKEKKQVVGLNRWRDTAKTFFSPGSEALAVTVLAGFAAVLMSSCGSAIEGGAVLSVVSESGQGKTIAANAATSIFGLWRGLTHKNFDSNMSQFTILKLLCHLPVVHDEMTMTDPKEVNQFLETFTQGEDRKRLDRDSTLKEDASTWQTILIACGNTSLVDFLSNGQDMRPMAYRILEVKAELPEHLKGKDGKRATDELELNAGYAGEEFIRRMLVYREYLPGWLAQAQERIREDVNFKEPNKYRYWVRLVACIAVANILVQAEVPILTFDWKNIHRWLIKLMRERSEGSPAASTVEHQAFREVSRMLSELGPHTLVINGIWEKSKATLPVPPLPRGQIVARHELGNSNTTIMIDAMQKYAREHQIPFSPWRDRLIETGIIKEQKKVTLTAGTQLPNNGQHHCVVLHTRHPLLDNSTERKENVTALFPQRGAPQAEGTLLSAPPKSQEDGR